MRKVWAVIRREFMERVRTRAMWISAILGPVFFAALIFLPMLMAGAGHKNIVVVDGTSSDFGARAADALAGNDFTVVRVMAGPRVVDSLTVEVSEDKILGEVHGTSTSRNILNIAATGDNGIEKAYKDALGKKSALMRLSMPDLIPKPAVFYSCSRR